MPKLKTEYIILASGAFLTEHLTKELIEGDEEIMLDWMDNHIVEYMEDYVTFTSELYDTICAHAESIQEHVESEFNQKLSDLEVFQFLKNSVLGKENSFEKYVSSVYEQAVDSDLNISRDQIRLIMRQGALK